MGRQDGQESWTQCGESDHRWRPSPAPAQGRPVVVGSIASVRVAPSSRNRLISPPPGWRESRPISHSPHASDCRQGLGAKAESGCPDRYGPFDVHPAKQWSLDEPYSAPDVLDGDLGFLVGSLTFTRSVRWAQRGRVTQKCPEPTRDPARIGRVFVTTLTRSNAAFTPSLGSASRPPTKPFKAAARVRIPLGILHDSARDHRPVRETSAQGRSPPAARFTTRARWSDSGSRTARLSTTSSSTPRPRM